MPEPNGSSDFYLSQVSPQDKPWDTHRANATAVQALYQKSEFWQYAARIQQCSQRLGFAFQATDEGELKLRLQQAKFCRVRHCPVCQWRRVLKWRAKFFTAVPKVMEAHPNGRWIFLTLTVRNCPLGDLRETLRQMNKAWVRLAQRKQFPAIGFVRSTEVTRSPDGSAHPHFHCLLLVKPSYFSGQNYVTQAQWAELWQDALRADYTPIIDVRSVKPRHSKINTISHALLETLKYTVKPDDLLHDVNWLQELTKQLHNTRAVSVGGVLRDFIDDKEPDDLIHIEEEAEAESDGSVGIWFGWREMVKRYVKTD